MSSQREGFYHLNIHTASILILTLSVNSLVEGLSRKHLDRKGIPGKAKIGFVIQRDI